jgi:hypothetical protein
LKKFIAKDLFEEGIKLQGLNLVEDIDEIEILMVN